MSKPNKKALKAAARYLEHFDYRIIDKDWSRDGLAGRIGIVAKDAERLVFVAVSVSTLQEDAGFREEPLSREQFELLAASWLAEHVDSQDPDVPVRFDRVSVMVFAKNRAMIRHHVNVLAEPGAFA